MNKIKQLVGIISDNKTAILKRTAIVGGTIVAVTLAAGLFKVVPTEAAVEAVEHVAKAAKKAAE